MVPRAISPSLKQFFETLLTPGHETLTSYVRSLHVEFEHTAAEPTSISSRNSITNTTLLSNGLESQGFQLILLLGLLPGLQVLHLNAHTFFTRLWHHTATLPCGLESLREFHCLPLPNINGTSDGLGPTTLLQFMKLPHIYRIDIPSVHRSYIPVNPLEAAAATSRVTHLRLSHALTSPSTLSSLLRVPIALTHFSFSAVSDSNVNLPAIMGALVHIRQSLRCLHLDFRDAALTSDDEGEWWVPHEEGSLRHWPVLRTLSCSLMPLLGKGQHDEAVHLVDVLPVSLRELEVLQDGHWRVSEEVDEVVEMLERKEYVVPQLEKLAVVMVCGRNEGLVQRLVAACERAQVSLVQESFCW